ncbi:hypothetical protein [Planobispora takensis]|uniref:Gram-positive cocci surface proteins LPxTG domain-containing protein n=1 Tax=Planobispora takensis TaxID=1367882 RepID=A0A8J3T340_9ACTN|nr:hypothetical protein [Planobispora takensis]GII03180.1 hypothetical protein Pta02_51880 [Planobispora takensis]
MPRVKLVAVLGAIALTGIAGCTAEANSGNPTGTPTPAATTTGAPRADIEVQLQPSSVRAGGKAWVLANCPIPQGGPAHQGTAASEIFETAITLDPILVTPTPATPGTSTPTPRPWVRGQATVVDNAKPGEYEVSVRCEGTNDTGSTTLRILQSSSPTPQPTTTRTIITTKAPGTGGGGTAAGGPEDSGTPIGLTAALVAAAVAGGVGVAVARRRRP